MNTGTAESGNNNKGVGPRAQIHDAPLYVRWELSRDLLMQLPLCISLLFENKRDLVFKNPRDDYLLMDVTRRGWARSG